MIEPIETVVKGRKNTFLNIPALDIPHPINGIIFMHTVWSTSFLQLGLLLESLQNFPDIPLYIFDTDHSNTIGIKSNFEVYSDGWGETFWFKSGKIVGIKKKYNREDLNELIDNNNMVKL